MRKSSKLLKLPWCFLSTVVESSLWPLSARPCLPQNSTHFMIEVRNSWFFFTMSFSEDDNMNEICEDGFPYVEINASILALAVRWDVVILWLLISDLKSFQFLYGFETRTSGCCRCVFWVKQHTGSTIQSIFTFRVWYIIKLIKPIWLAVPLADTTKSSFVLISLAGNLNPVGGALFRINANFVSAEISSLRR